jgi:hypothetical protein
MAAGAEDGEDARRAHRGPVGPRRQRAQGGDGAARSRREGGLGRLCEAGGAEGTASVSVSGGAGVCLERRGDVPAGAYWSRPLGSGNGRLRPVRACAGRMEAWRHGLLFGWGIRRRRRAGDVDGGRNTAEAAGASADRRIHMTLRTQEQARQTQEQALQPAPGAQSESTLLLVCVCVGTMLTAPRYPSVHSRTGAGAGSVLVSHVALPAAWIGMLPGIAGGRGPVGRGSGGGVSSRSRLGGVPGRSPLRLLSVPSRRPARSLLVPWCGAQGITSTCTARVAPRGLLLVRGVPANTCCPAAGLLLVRGMPIAQKCTLMYTLRVQHSTMPWPATA